jgi:hypothetical protein
MVNHIIGARSLSDRFMSYMFDLLSIIVYQFTQILLHVLYLSAQQLSETTSLAVIEDISVHSNEVQLPHLSTFAFNSA